MKKKILDSAALYTIISILIGFLVGAVLLLCIGISPAKAYAKLISGVFSKPKFIVYSIVYAAPLIFTGLSVAFSFRTGIFNIGAEGQYVVGSLSAVVVGILVPIPGPLHAIVCILAAALAGAAWGAIVGVLKVKKGINEVLSYIMFNWIAFYLSNYVVNIKAIHTDQGAEASKNILDSASIKMPKAIVQLTGCGDVHWGIVMAVVAAVLIWFLMSKTTLGYELRAVGFSKTASEYAGISVNRIFLLSMSISGLLAGLGGAVQTLGMAGRVSQFASQEQYGFQGITVALVGATHPIGCIFSGLFYGAMKYGGNKLTVVNVPTEVVNIIMGTIIIFISISHVFKAILQKALLKNGGNQ
jgi:ABC-type uncharacterized transport system permease subunit